MKDLTGLTRRRFLRILTSSLVSTLSLSGANTVRGKSKIEHQATESRLNPEKTRELTKRFKSAICCAAERTPEGVPYVKQYHLKQIKENYPAYLGPVKKALEKDGYSII